MNLENMPQRNYERLVLRFYSHQFWSDPRFSGHGYTYQFWLFVLLRTNNGKIEMKVVFVSKSNNKIEIKFEISDTGVGVPIEMLDKIFLPFVQVDQIENNTGGTGLGLSICKKLINAMGGEISVKSKINEGSRFYFNLVLGIF